MADFTFLETLNRRQKRDAANLLRGVHMCLECNLFGKCYKEQTNILTIQEKHHGTLLPKNARDLPTEICEFHESRNEKGRFYPCYDMVKQNNI